MRTETVFGQTFGGSSQYQDMDSLPGELQQAPHPSVYLIGLVCRKTSVRQTHRYSRVSMKG